MSTASHRSCVAAFLLGSPIAVGGLAQSVHPSMPLYKQSQAPTEMRVDDLLRRMTLMEKVRQLDLYSGAKELVIKHLDDTHTPDAVFLPENFSRRLWQQGSLLYWSLKMDARSLFRGLRTMYRQF